MHTLKIECFCVTRPENGVKTGWDRHLAYSYKLTKSPSHIGKSKLISLTSEILLQLYRLGWEPMTPIDLCVKRMDNQTAICFRKGFVDLNDTASTTPRTFRKVYKRFDIMRSKSDC